MMTTEEKRLLDMFRIMDYDSKGTKGWLVRFNYYPSKKWEEMKCHSKLFTWSKYASPDAALEAARKYRDEWTEKHKDELWLRGGGEYNQVLPKNNTSGILGVRRHVRTLPSGTRYAEWQVTVNLANGDPINTKFSIKRWGEIGALMKAVEFRRMHLTELLSSDRFRSDPGIPKLLDYYDDILANLAEMREEAGGRSIVDIAADEEIDATSKYEEISVRIGQQRFRRRVLEHFECRCAVTGSRVLVRASHIKPWRESSDSERLDWRNGLALSPAYDAAFDRGYISFGANREILIVPQSVDDLSLLGVNKTVTLRGVTETHLAFLDWHRKHVYKGGSPNHA
jgi:hypothetical protein